MSRSSASAVITTLGIDLHKNSFHLVSQDEGAARHRPGDHSVAKTSKPAINNCP
jgi:hypothetical protein